MPFRSTLKATTTAITLALVAAPMAVLTPQTVAAQATESYTAEELDAFTVALIGVAGVREKYTPVLQSAESEDQQAAVVEEANAEIIDVIEQTEGMTMDRYLEIAQAASEDQTLNQRITKRVQAMETDTQ